MTHRGIIHMPAQPADGIQQCARCRCRLMNSATGHWTPGGPVVYQRGGASVIWPADDISQARECKARPTALGVVSPISTSGSGPTATAMLSHSEHRATNTASKPTKDKGAF